jgi:hypothetical protein
VSTWIEQHQSMEQAWQRARMWSFANRLLGVIRRRPTGLLPLEALRARIYIRGQRDLGSQTVLLDDIVGSEGRAIDFDRYFMPRSTHVKTRWTRIVSAYLNAVTLPPVELIKVGAVYFVRDGNHRISVARQQGQREIDAHVIELRTDVHLRPDLDLRELSRIEEQSDFWEWTNLGASRSCVPIEVSTPGGYLVLIAHINRHRANLSAERGVEVDRAEAIVHWFDNVYWPIVSTIACHRARRSFGRATDADLYIQVVKYWKAQDASGNHLSATKAASEFMAQHGSRFFGRSQKRGA